MTQEELLAEAKETEKQNLLSLGEDVSVKLLQS
jgi:hypothetical protein